jgi:hypothetical protein
MFKFRTDEFFDCNIKCSLIGPTQCIINCKEHRAMIYVGSFGFHNIDLCKTTDSVIPDAQEKER